MALIDASFPHTWSAEILPGRPLILPARQFVYPAQVEEVERGALEVLVRPAAGLPFLATCALGFASPGLPTGVWACPDPNWMCAVSGGYAYMIDTLEPTRWGQIQYRPVTAIWTAPSDDLIVFAGFQALLAWGAEGERWQTRRLSWDGLTILSAGGGKLLGLGWDMHTDREMAFEVDLKTGEHQGGGYLL